MPALFPNSASTDSYKIGDTVRWYISERAISPYIGRVVAINPKTVKIWVTWPVGDTTQHGPEELIFVPPEQGSSPITQRGGYDSYEITQSEKYFGKLTPATMPPSDLQKAASDMARQASVSKLAGAFLEERKTVIASEVRSLKASGLGEVQAYLETFGKHGSLVPDEMIREAVTQGYKQ